MLSDVARAQSPPPPTTTPAPVPSDGLKLRYGVEYWIRSSWTGDFDFDGRRPDGLVFGWQRVKPFFGGQRGWFEFALQGQDSRSYGVPELNPNGSSTYASRTSQLDFVKAFVKVTPRAGLSIKAGREQADGSDIGISRKLASSSNYGTVLKSFDLLSARWDMRASSLMGFFASPVDNRPYALNRRHVGETLWGVQGTRTSRRNVHRAYFVRRSIGADGPASETGVRSGSVTHALGFQETGPLLLPGVTWEAEGIFEWGHRSTDTLRAGAVFVTATHAFAPEQTLWVGYHQASGDGRRGDGASHLYDTMYSSGFNNYGYMGLSQGRNIGDLRVGGSSRLARPATLLWAYHEQFLSVGRDQWYAIFTPNVSRPEATSSRLGREIDATLMLRFPFAKRATIALGYLAFLPGGYLSSSGPHAPAQQIAIDISGQF
ncbi:MAG: alginate export family protein [Vicinamibacterales bacterium]